MYEGIIQRNIDYSILYACPYLAGVHEGEAWVGTLRGNLLRGKREGRRGGGGEIR
jgi:hypothetical protein